ncbi:MAG: alpha/beta fold hydrolase [Bryobacterales bacterium]|nr:alpha/beta fold hydrolase [Bryobacterales bacterium]
MRFAAAAERSPSEGMELTARAEAEWARMERDEPLAELRAEYALRSRDPGWRIISIMRFVAFLVMAALGCLADGFARRPDGARIAYALREGKGPNLVLIPGTWGTRAAFDRFVAALPADLRVVIVELRGHGESRPPAAAPSMESLADDVLAAVDAAVPAGMRFYVGGHSIGGMLAIEIAGRRPGQVAGAIPMEGWAHHLVQKEAFPNAPAVPSPARQLVAMTEAEKKAMGAVWRQWDGAPILERSPVPFLQVWGDRGMPRPSRKLLRIPEKESMELVWMAGASHSLLKECPEAVARATADFIARMEARHMFAVTSPVRVPVESVVIARAREGTNGFNMHPYLAHFGGRFWAIWSSNRVRDLQAGQYVRYATSVDGVHWSEPGAVTPSEEAGNYRYFARGLWVRNGELWALAARDEAVRPLFGPGLELRGYKWAGGRWQGPVLVAADAINNFAPEPLTSGEWMMSKRDHKMRISMLIGDLGRWRETPMAGSGLDEPIWWTLPDGVLTAAFRDGNRSRRLFRAFSYDGGESWTAPARTDFPDAMAKFNVVRLRSGLYVIASNPNPSGVRIPLSLSVSRDGRIFHGQAILRDAPTVYRYAGKDPGYAGYHYPQLLEHGESLYVIHSENMEDIVLLRVPLAAVARLAR